MPELKEIRRIWLVDKREIEDALPGIYESVSGRQWPKEEFDRRHPFGEEEIGLLKDICGEDRLHFELARELLAVEQQFQGRRNRRGIFSSIEKAFLRSGYDGIEDAVNNARWRQEAMDRARDTSAYRYPVAPSLSKEFEIRDGGSLT